MIKESNNVGVFKTPSDIHFMGHEKAANSSIPHSSVELIRMSRDGIWVNPDIPVEETAKQVLEILDNALKNMVRIAVEEEREACAALCFQMWSKWMDSRVGNEILDNSNCPDAEDCAFAIRERGAP